MRAFDYYRAETLPAARVHAVSPSTRVLAGGTTLIDLMKCGVERPDHIVDITHLPKLDSVSVDHGMIHIGALVKMSQVADDAAVKVAAPAVVGALLQAASAQLRNMATIGGNLLQRTRCGYFRDPAAYDACNKRSPGSGCAAIEGIHRNHAVLGVSDACIASYPGDLAVALVAFDASVRILGERERTIPVEALYRLPGDRPDLEHDLAPGELITAIEIPLSRALSRSLYLKVRDRTSYEFAAASAAVGLEMEPDGKTIRDARVALGGVATKPWRSRTVEAALNGQILSEATLRSASRLCMADARPHEHNSYKVTLGPRVVARALMQVGGLA